MRRAFPTSVNLRPVGGVLCTSGMTGAWDVGDVARRRWIGGGGLGSLTQQEDAYFKRSVPSMHFSHLHVCPIWLKEKERLLAVCFRLGACKFNSDRMLYIYIHTLPYKSWNLLLLEFHIGWADFLTNPAGHSL